jgi:serine/threonine protein kinase
MGNYRGQKVAVKTMSTVDADNLSRFRDEIILMSDLHHPNVVFMVGACWEKKLMALVLEFCEQGTASDNLTPDINWGDPLFKWAKDIALGIGEGRWGARQLA